MHHAALSRFFIFSFNHVIFHSTISVYFYQINHTFYPKLRYYRKLKIVLRPKHLSQMTKKLSLLILTSIIVSSCSVTKNWKSDHPSDNFLKASFDEFTGTEKLKFPKQANALVYLSSTVSTSQGKVLLSLKNLN